MGLDLTICPAHPSFGEVTELPKKGHLSPHLYNRLSLLRDYALFEQIENSPGIKDIPKGAKVDWYGDDGIQSVKDCPYGCPVQYMRAKDFEGITSENVYNQTILSFLRAQPPEAILYIWWH